MTKSPEGPLFKPLELGSMRLSGRIAMAPMTRSFSPGGIPGPDVAAYYRRRAEGGAALIITEGTYVGHDATIVDHAVPCFWGDAALAGWHHVAAQVHAGGAAIIPQLWHVGIVEVRETLLSRKTIFRPELGQVGPSGILWPGRHVTDPMTTAQIDDVIEAFAVAAADAQRLGFDGVELHGAHGYLIDQFFWEQTNRRTDRYGGTPENRGRLAAEIVAEIRRRSGPDFPILLRVSQWKQQDYAARLAESPGALAELLRPCVEAGVTMFHCSQRRYWEPEFAGSDLNFAGWVKKITGLPTMTVGSVGLNSEFVTTLVEQEDARPAEIDRLIAMLERGEFDLVAVGRALLGDANWPHKLREGRLNEFVGFNPSLLAELN